MAGQRFTMPAGVHLVLLRDDEVLLLLRKGGFGDGCWSVVAGHLDGQESASAAMVREAYEEAGIVINPRDLHFSCIMHCRFPDREPMYLFYVCRSWQNEIRNMEPDKCCGLQFFPARLLPENMVEYVREGIRCSLAGQQYCEYGWDNSPGGKVS